MKRMGIEGQLFYGAPGSTAGTLISNCRSPSIKIESKKADTTTRAGLTDAARAGQHGRHNHGTDRRPHVHLGMDDA